MGEGRGMLQIFVFFAAEDEPGKRVCTKKKIGRL